MQTPLTALRLSAAFLSLSAPALAQNLQFSGFENQPLGQGVLSEDAAGNMLVDNLGSSGMDGVRVHGLVKVAAGRPEAGRGHQLPATGGAA